jgi:catechol 2,3-dioxygenase-like lactoylglutathione lyase family enzyme
MSTLVDATTRFHLGLYASDLARSTRFYQTLFGLPPAKQFHEYVRFESGDPPLVLTLKSHPCQGGGVLNHVGIRLTDSKTLVDIQRRLEESGISTQRQDGVECCYARQTKFWVTDPDRVLWELYILEEDIDHSGTDDVPLPKVRDEASGPLAVWEHRMSEPFPDRLPFADGELDEVHLLGTLNAMVEPHVVANRLAEAKRVLRAGGRLIALGLIGDKPHNRRLDLPGQASKCEYLPVEHEPLDALALAGIQDVYYEKLHDVNCVGVPGIDLRSFRLVGRKPSGDCQPRSLMVMYRGPFVSVTGDDGTVFHRGEWSCVTRNQSDAIRSGPAADQFVFMAVPQVLPLATVSLGSCCRD